MKRTLLIGILLLFALLPKQSVAQPQIAYITPDAGAPGMCVAVEIVAPGGASAPFGSDQMYTDGSLVHLTRPSDTALVRLGPSIVSWDGRLIQQMFLLKPNTKVRDTEVYFKVVYQGASSAVDSFEIVAPYDLGTLSGGGPIIGPRTKRNTLVVDSLNLLNGTYTVPTLDPDPSTPGNQAYLPFRILSLGPIRLTNATISVNGVNGTTGSGGGNGGPGGGGGGAGYPGSGGAGYTGGGGDNDNASGPGGVGTGSISGNNAWDGGSSLNGVAGGTGEQHTSSGFDDGGGGGTGLPFGTSGQHGDASSGPAGGYGGGSAGGSTSNYLTDYGGGGGGFESAGGAGGGGGNNEGQANGNAMLVPLMGGSGGGAGNATYNSFLSPSTKGGSGGGGGGAIELTSFSNVTIPSGGISANGGNGSNGNSSTLPAAGGGAGSGGAIAISARDSIVIASSSSIMETGGTGGSGQNSGGAGGLGRVRINGMVSTDASPSSSKFFSTSKDFTGPSIQHVSSTPDSVFVHGYAESWDGVPSSSLPIEIYYSWPGSTVWQSTSSVPKVDPKSHTYQWDAVFPNSTKPIDTQVYVVAVQDENLVSGGHTDVPSAIMSHTSGIIAKVVKPAKIALSTSSIDFGTVVVDSCSRDTTLEIYSVGGSPLIVDSIRWFPPLADYSYVANHVFPDTIPVGDSLTLTPKFCPTKVQCPIASALEIYSNAQNGKDTAVNVTGCGIEPHALLRPLILNFGRVRIGDCKDSFVYIIDTGSSPLTVTRESLGDLTHFKILDSLPIVVPAHDSEKINLEFCPSDTAQISTLDSIQSNAPESPNVLTLLGSGKIGILSAPSVLNFGLVHLDTCIDSGFYVVNTGNDSLLVTSVTMSGSTNFTSSWSNIPFEIGAGDSVFVSVRYCSMDTGAATGSITFTTDVPDSGTILLLAHSGLGILSIPDTINFGTVPTGSCVDTTIFVQNIGTDTLFLDTPASIVPPFRYLGPTPLILAPGASDSVKFWFCSTDTNAHSETTAFDTMRPGISPVFTLLGKGSAGALATSGAIDLGCIALGTHSTDTVTIRNTGTAALDSLIASVIPPSIASIVHEPPATLAAGDSNTIVLVIPASSYGPISGTLSIAWSGGTTVTLPITGNVTTPPKITALDTFAAFDTVTIGDSSSTICIRVTNYSCIPVAVNSATILGALPGEFSIVSNSVPSSLSDSIIETICVRYKPNRIGPDSAGLAIVTGRDTIDIAKLTGVGAGNAIGVQLALDTVAGRPGEIVKVPVRTLNDITSAAITSLTFRITFDPMQLDLKQPVAPPTLRIIPAQPLSTTATYSIHTYSIGDKEITATYSSPLTGTPTVAELPFEILEPTANTAAIHLVSATFGASPASLTSASDGEIQIEQCDTSDRVGLSIAPMIVSQNTPNPFNTQTTIRVNVQIAGHLTVELFNALGSKVLVPFDGDVAVGTKSISIDASKLPAGAYHYITTWTGTRSMPYAPESARDEKTMVIMGN